MLTLWIKHIILIVLFAAFMELLIPNNSYKKFISVVMGMMVLLAVLQPVLDILDRRFDEAPATAVSGTAIADTKAKVADGTTKLQNERDRAVMEQYHKELSKQIRVLATSVEGVADAHVVIVFHDVRNEKNYSSIKHLNIAVKPGQKDGPSIKTVQGISIGKPNPEAERAPGLSTVTQERVRRVVAEFYHLQNEQVEITEWQGK